MLTPVYLAVLAGIVVAPAGASFAVATVGARVVSAAVVSLAFAYLPILFALYKYRQFPGPMPWPLLGNLASVAGGDIDEVYAQWQLRYPGGVFKWFMGTKPILVLGEASLVREVALRKFSSFTNHAPVPEGMGAFFPDKLQKQAKLGMDVSKDQEWRGLRSTGNAIFHSHERMASFVPLMRGAANELALRLQGVGEGELVDIWKWLGEMTLDVIGSTVFGVRFDSKDGSPNDAVKAARLIFNSIDITFATNPYMTLSMMLPSIFTPLLKTIASHFPTNSMREFASASEYLGAVSDRLAAEAASGEAAKPPAGTDGDADAHGLTYINGGQSLLRLFVQAHSRETGESLSKDQVTAQAFLFLLAGYDTTANTLAMAVYLLSKNKDKEAKLIAEIDRLKGTQMPGQDELKAYEYVEAVVKEALRLHGPVPLTDRVAGEDAVIGGKYNIYKGDVIHFALRNLQLDAKNFPTDPLAFEPERFIPGSEVAKTQNIKAWNPWGLGPRMCVASNFALTEAMLALITLYSRYSFTLKEGYELKTKMKATVSPVGGVPVHVHLRKKP